MSSAYHTSTARSSAAGRQRIGERESRKRSGKRRLLQTAMILTAFGLNACTSENSGPIGLLFQPDF
ncbi:MAG TPA: hypothetical protein VGM59_16350, partial [Dongiaceae bacterium]